MNREDIMNLVKESYERGQSDLMESCKEAAIKAIESAILAEREANIKCVGRIAAFTIDPIDRARLFEAMDAIRARVNT
jgi:hypothetical protein